MRPMKVLFEEPGELFDLPEDLSLLYGGSIGLPQRVLYANFVASLDGVVALPSHPQSSGLISGHNEADHLVMGLLRACADAVLIGAETFRAAPGTFWTPRFIYQEAATAFTELRERLGRSPEPQLVIVTASGKIDATQPALRAGALVLTTEETAGGLRKELAGSAEVVALAERAPLDLRVVVEHLRSLGHEVLLTEGGPTVIGRLVDGGLLDELFFTLSPVLAGRSADEYRPGIVEGIELLPERGTWSSLHSVRSHGQHLFLRYGLRHEQPV